VDRNENFSPTAVHERPNTREEQGDWIPENKTNQQLSQPCEICKTSVLKALFITVLVNTGGFAHSQLVVTHVLPSGGRRWTDWLGRMIFRGILEPALRLELRTC
jgi:hypothetical protein